LSRYFCGSRGLGSGSRQEGECPLGHSCWPAVAWTRGGVLVSAFLRLLLLLAAGNQDQAENGQNEWMEVEVGGGDDDAAGAAKSVGEATLYFSGRTTDGVGGVGSGFGAGHCAQSRNLAPIPAPHPKVAPRGYDRRPSRTASGRIVARRRSLGRRREWSGWDGGREGERQGGRGM